MSTTSLKSPTLKLPVREKELFRPSFASSQIAILLLVSDITVLLFSLQGIFLLHTGRLALPPPPFTGLFILIFIGCLYLANTYRYPSLQISGLHTPAFTLVSNLIPSALWATTIYIFGIWSQDSILSHHIWPIVIVVFSIWAYFSRILVVRQLKKQARLSSWLLIGFGLSQEPFLQDFKSLKLTDNIVTLLDKGQAAPLEMQDEEVGSLTDLDIWLTQPWSNILISSEIKINERHLQSIKHARLQGITVYRVSDLYESYLNKIPAITLQDSWFTFSDGFHLLSNCVSLRIKRLGDVVLAVLLLCLTFPMMLLTVIAIKLESVGPVFYSQLRTGHNMKPFRLYKFRSMYQDAEKHGIQWASKQDSRITRVGNFIRLVRIDELPQLWNVLRGDMSIIGPRPERPEIDQKLTDEIPHYTVRYLVKPGITGWAQVLYPYGASVKDAYEKLSYDLYYIKNYSFWLDIAIVFKTLRIVLLGKGR